MGIERETGVPFVIRRRDVHERGLLGIGFGVSLVGDAEGVRIVTVGLDVSEFCVSLDGLSSRSKLDVDSGEKEESGIDCDAASFRAVIA